MLYFNATQRFIVTFQSNSHKMHGLILVLSLLQIADITKMFLRPCVSTKLFVDASAQYTLHVNPNGKQCQQMCVFSRACFTAVCLSTLWSQTLDRSCEVSITSKSNGGPVLLHFTSWEVLIGSFLGKWAKNSSTKADKCNRRRKDYQSNGVKPAFAVTEAKPCLICVPRHAIQLLIQFRNHKESLFSPHRDTHLPFRHNWISIKMYHYEYSWHYRVRIHRYPGRL